MFLAKLLLHHDLFLLVGLNQQIIGIRIEQKKVRKRLNKEFKRVHRLLFISNDKKKYCPFPGKKQKRKKILKEKNRGYENTELCYLLNNFG